MSLNLPTAESNPTFPAQAVLDATDMGAITSAINRSGVISGCTVSTLATPGYAVTVAAGAVLAANLQINVSAVASIAPSAASTFDRRDIVVVAANGTVSIVAGSPCAVAGWTTTSGVLPPVKPAVPGGSVLLGEVYIPGNNGTTAIQSGNIVDKTTIVTFNQEVFGDGSDGAVVFDGSSTVLGIAPVINAYILTRDIFCTSIQINSGCSIFVAGYRVFCTGAITGPGTITNADLLSSQNATTNNVISGGGSSGANGGTGAGSASSAATNSLGGRGASGGLGSSGAGGTAGTVTAPVSNLGSMRALTSALTGLLWSAVQLTPIAPTGGSGGGGGGGDGSHAGGPGGYGSGAVVVVAQTIATTITIQSNGGAGGPAVAGGNSGGGGGGGGGYIIVVSGTPNAPTCSVAGGLGGAKTGSGVAGSNGSPGTVYKIQV